jgi:tight adherence protein B
MSPTIILIAGGGFALLLLVVGLLVSSRDERSLVDERLEYLEEDGYTTKDSQERSAAMTEWLGKQAGRYSWGQNMSRSLARADLKLRVGEYMALTVILSVGGAALGWYLGGGPSGGPMIASLPGILLGAGLGFFAPKLYVGRLQGRRLMRFDNQLADMLNLMVNGLRAGYSIMQAMEAVSRELPPPISDEFRRVVQEMQLGVAMETSLENLKRRIPSRDLDLVITAMNVQREVGGNLAEILDTISHTIRERVRVKGEIRVLTTQAMMSGKFLALMPVFLIIAMYFMNRSYMMRFFNPETRMFGIPILIAGAFMIMLGYWLMTRIAAIEV